MNFIKRIKLRLFKEQRFFIGDVVEDLTGGKAPIGEVVGVDTDKHLVYVQFDDYREQSIYPWNSQNLTLAKTSSRWWK